MKPIELFDSWTTYGPRPGKDPLERWTLDHLREDLDAAGITRALVRHEQGALYDAMFVNRLLTKELANHRTRMFPCWTVTPHHCGDFPDPKELGRLLEGEDIRAVQLMPGTQRYPLDAAYLQPLAEVLNARNTLILVDWDELKNPFADGVGLCGFFEHCPVLLGNVGWGSWRWIAAILDRCPNACFESHGFQGNRSPEWFAHRHGPGRLVFGSGLVRHSGGAARGLVDYTLLGKQECASFAGDALRQWLGAEPARETVPAAARDEIERAAIAGRPLPVPVLDAHAHLLHDGLNGAGKRYVMPGGDLENMLALNRHMGVDLMAVMSWAGPCTLFTEEGNRLIAEAVRRAPGEVIGLSSCDPTHQSETEIAALCRHLHQELGFRGMKPYVTSGISYADPAYRPWWSFCNRYRLYALLHTAPNAGGLEAVDRLAAEYPDAHWVVAHTCGSWALSRKVATLIHAHPNVYAEITLTSVPNGIIEWLVSQAGADRVLYGSDAPMRDPRPQLAWCMYADLPLADKRLLLGGAFARILSRNRLPGHALPNAVVRALDNAQSI